LCVGILSSIDCLRFVIVAIVARFFYISIVVFDYRNNAALASESAATRAAGVGDASARRGRVLGVVAAYERFWCAAGEWTWGHREILGMLLVMMPGDRTNVQGGLMR
jgi:hypothetical protein